MSTNRRKFIAGSLGTIALAAIPTGLSATDNQAYNDLISEANNRKGSLDEDFWFKIRLAYSDTSNFINLNNGGVSPQPIAVQEALTHYTKIANEAPAFYMWRHLQNFRETARKSLAKIGGVSPQEIALTRNTTESLETIIFGLPLQKGDEILTSVYDYPSMRGALDQRVRRDGIKVTQVTFKAATKNKWEIVKTFEKAITSNTKALLFSHMINLNGEVLPAKEIIDMAHRNGLEVILDGAHSFCHFPFSIKKLDCDYFGTSLHKWLCAPFGTGMLYIKEEKISKVWPLFAGPASEDNSITKFEHLGTRPFPNEIAVNKAIEFHAAVGTKRKADRLAFLTKYWIDRVKRIPGFQLNTPLQKGRYYALANFSMEGLSPTAIQRKLLDEHQIFTVAIQAEGMEGVRVSPHIYTSLDELDRLVDAVHSLKK